MRLPAIVGRIWRALVSERMRVIGWVLLPTALALTMDMALRLRVLIEYPPFELVNYLGSTTLSAGLWAGSLWLASRLFVARSRAGKIGLFAFYLFWILPLATFCFGGQALYYRVFHSYMQRDTVRLGISLRGTLKEWLSAWGGPASYIGILLVGVVVSLFIMWCGRKAAPVLSKTIPIIPFLGLSAALIALWVDFVESRTLQSALPDTCFAHGVAHAVRDGVTGKGWVRRGISLRTPDPVPPVPHAAHRPNVMLIITESVRADAMCSVHSPICSSRFLETTIPDRIGLGLTTTQSPGTFSACMMIWTGLPPNADFAVIHRAPTIWEVARAAGYATSYVTSQNMAYDDFHLFTDRAGIDYSITGLEIGNVQSQQMGAPDEIATKKMIEYVQNAHADQPYFAVLHYSNTHSPYRTDPSLLPFTPDSDDPIADIHGFRNHYRNSVVMQERTIADLFTAIRALPSFEDTVVVFVSDHGEQFRDHGSLYHNHSLYDEELRIPGFVVTGARGLTEEQRAGLRTFAGRRTYSQDLNATLLDLLGVLDVRGTFPFADELTGRSLLRPAAPEEPVALISTATGVWEPDTVFYGAIQGKYKLIASPAGNPICYDTAADPAEHRAMQGSSCAPLDKIVKQAFPDAHMP